MVLASCNIIPSYLFTMFIHLWSVALWWGTFSPTPTLNSLPPQQFSDYSPTQEQHSTSFEHGRHLAIWWTFSLKSIAPWEYIVSRCWTMDCDPGSIPSVGMWDGHVVTKSDRWVSPGTQFSSHTKTIRTQTSVPTSMVNISCIYLL